MKGFKTEKEAARKALKLGLVGLYGSGQRCGPERLPDGTFCYHTAYNAFGGEPAGEILLADGLFEPAEVFIGDWAKY